MREIRIFTKLRFPEMAFDGLMMKKTKDELNSALLGGRTDKINMPNSHEVVLVIRNKGKNHKLLLSTLPQEARIQLTENSFINPEKPAVFCMVLRKHLENAKLEEISQIGLDRILCFHFSAINEMGDLTNKKLICEIMGKHSNIILTEKDRIIDAIHHIPLSLSRYRQVLPGETYILPPPQTKTPLWEESEESFNTHLKEADQTKALDKVLLGIYAGIGPSTVQEILYRAGLSPLSYVEELKEAQKAKLFLTLKEMGTNFLEEKEKLCYNEKEFSPITLTQWDSFEEAASCKDLFDLYYKDRAFINLFHQKKADLSSLITRELDKCTKKAALQKQTIDEARSADLFRLYGELLMASAYQLKPGKTARVLDYTKEEETYVDIPLEENLSVIDNGKKYFSKYQKAKKTLEKAAPVYEETLSELDYLDSLFQSLNTVTTLEELKEIKEEIKESGLIKETLQKKTEQKYIPGKPGKKKYIPQKQSHKKERPAVTPTYGKENFNGFEILYGKNNKQNDYVTMKLAKPEDIWLHVQKVPSSHVIIKNPDKKAIPDSVLEQAAKLCMEHSGASLGACSVDYTPKANVWKPKGAKPGMVLYENFRTIYLKKE